MTDHKTLFDSQQQKVPFGDSDDVDKGKQAAKISSFYERDAQNPIESQIYHELEQGLAHTHTVHKTEYYISGKDHLSQKTINQYSLVKKLG